ncbi:hypothetical protein FAES_4249 [Fibrella aestuarina BUZ 2]|uniref:GxxExxY protein n=1 Tax=Fibrella aestuarina BUZ 2 TaxID=1166018 RepID=I0KDP6_9BACT|nr:GxxExxY protein [Fibrella aestuarina]CCH02249.1 hypothetical protein FAES_4249 [Fibrella aestuarina BUZ 2]
MLHDDLTNQIISAFYTVYNELGYGFLERVYENALCLELQSRGLQCLTQQPVKVYYQGVEVGNYFADLIVDELVIVELKAVDQIRPEHEYQLLNYLKATTIEVGLLLNFGRKSEIKRKIYRN